jgi:hypothetical protein
VAGQYGEPGQTYTVVAVASEVTGATEAGGAGAELTGTTGTDAGGATLTYVTGGAGGAGMAVLTGQTVVLVKTV